MLHFLTDLKLRGSNASRPRAGHEHASPDPDQWAQMIARGKARRFVSEEPSLDEVLDDPLIRRVMQSDRVDPSDIRRFAIKKET